MTKKAQKAMRDFAKQVKRIEDCYTGGGIYCYRGMLTDGRAFIGDDSWEENVADIVNIDPYQKDWEALIAESETAVTGEATKATIIDLWNNATHKTEV